MFDVTQKTLKDELKASAEQLIEYAQKEESVAKQKQDQVVVCMNNAAHFRARAAEYQALADAQP